MKSGAAMSVGGSRKERIRAMPELVVRSRQGNEFTIPLTERAIKVGRAESCDIVLRNDGEVSREHAELWVGDGQRVMVADLNSKNGTRVDSGEVFRNATRIASKRVFIGEHQIEIRGELPDSNTTVSFTPDVMETVGGTHFFPSSQRLDLNQKRLGLLIGLAERLGGTFDRKQLLEQALDACCEALNFERGLIVLKTLRGEPEMPVTRNMGRDEHGAFKVSRSLINRALVDGERAIVNNPATDLVGNITDSLVRFPICSALCVPILHREEILGVIYGDRITDAGAYKPRDVDFLAAIAQQVGVGLTNLRLAQEQVKTRAFERELDQARTIQRMLLPPAPLVIGGMTIEGFNEPSSAVGGDYFDFFELGDGKVCAIIADVTGHGLAAALIMANLQAAVRVSMGHDTKLPELATRINQLICRNTGAEVFITAIVAVIDSQTGTVDLINAGHPGPLLLGNTVRAWPDDDNSLPLGISPDEKYAVQQIQMGNGTEGLMLYTDGMSEAGAPQSPLLGVEPVVDALAALSDRSTGSVIRLARHMVRKHLNGVPPGDDMTFLAVQFTN